MELQGTVKKIGETDKRNKPELDKIGTNKIGRIRQSKEDIS